MKKQLRTGSAVLVLLLGAVLMWTGMGGEIVQTADAIGALAQRDGVTVTVGAPEGTEQVSYTRRQLLQGKLLLISALHPLPADYPAPNVRGVRQVVGAYLPAQEQTALAREVIQALCDMQFDRPLTDVTLLRGAVSRAQQDALRLEAFHRYCCVTSLEEAARLSRLSTPAGGESEHQTGCCVDLILQGNTQMGKQDVLEWNETGLWLRDNMWRYGFIRRGSPEAMDEEHVCDSLHIRYVGRVHAAAMYAGGWTLEEYLDVLQSCGAITVCEQGQRDAYVYWLPYDGEGGMQALLPSRFGDASLTNTGGAVFTCMAQP